MTKHEIRTAAFLALFQYEFYDEDITEQIRIFLEEDNDYPTDVVKDLEERLYNLSMNIESIDALISEASENWTIQRMNKVDLAILRLATFEMRYEDLEVGIAINEAVEIAKEYGTDESGGFVNGILGRIARSGS